MSQYEIQMGYNLNAGPVIGTSDLYPLQHAVIDDNEGPAWYTRFKKGDTFLFHLANISKMGGTVDMGGLTNARLQMACRDPHDTSIKKSPFDFDPEDEALSLELVSEPQPLHSPVYSHDETTKFAMWRVRAKDATGVEQLFNLTDAGPFELSVQFTCTTAEGETKKFVFDPEMFIGEG